MNGVEKDSIATKLQCAVGHHQAGRLAEAEELYRQVLQEEPNQSDALHLLGVISLLCGNIDNAVSLIGRAINASPTNGNYYFNLGNVLQAKGHLEGAVASYRQALLLKPDYPEAHSNLGNALRAQGHLDEAVACCQRALALRPDYPEAYNNLGTALKDQGRLDEAIASYRQALLLRPGYADACNNLGAVLQAQNRLDEAVSTYRQALVIRSDSAMMHYNLGNAFQAQGKQDEAVACYRQALLIKPDFAEAHYNQGNALLAQGRLDEAFVCYRKALLLKPDYEDAFRNLLFNLNYHPDKSAEEIFSVYREYDEKFGLPFRPTWRNHPNHRETRRRLKVGYVSPDFRFHSVRHFLEPLLAHHDKQQVEVYAYAELMQEDAVTARYKRYVDHWIPTVGMTDAAIAERIRQDGIDILVDLAGHTGQNRLQVFAHKPAPVSVTWLGCGYTTGLTAIDYILTDTTSAPEGSEGLFAETPWRVDTSCYVYRPAEGMGEVSPLPAATRGSITFGTLTRSVRINHRTIRVWSEILRKVAGSRLVFDSSSFQNQDVQTTLAGQFATHGIAREQLEFGSHSPPWDVLRSIDIGLDCFPHNSGTTLLETLYMGLPFVTLAGRPSVGRIGSTILEGAGHPEWIARTEEAYIMKAVELASDLKALANLRAGLRTEMEASPLRDEAGFARKIEAAYREMFVAWSEKHR